MCRAAQYCESKVTSGTGEFEVRESRTLRNLLEDKTGVTGPWVLGLGLGAWLISKEIYIVGPEMVETAVILGTMYVLYQKIGGQVGEYFDNQAQEILDGMNTKRDAYVKELETAISDENSTEVEIGVLKDVFEVHRVSLIILLGCARFV